MRDLRRRVVLPLLAIIVSSFVGVVLVEIGLRIVDYSRPPFYQYDPETGTSHRPNAEGWYDREDLIKVHINSHGLRGPEVPIKKPPGVFRIAVLGDSFAEGFQVDYDKRFSKVMQDDLNAGQCGGSGKRIEVLNFGVSGYGQAREILMFRHRAKAYQPDLVLLQFHGGNDFRNNTKEVEHNPFNPYFVFDSGNHLVLDRSNLDSPAFRHKVRWSNLRNDIVVHVRVLQVLQDYYERTVIERETAAAEADAIDPSVTNVRTIAVAPPDSDIQRKQWRLTEAHLRLLSNEVRDATAASLWVFNVPPALALLPDPNKRRQQLDALKLPDADYVEHRLAHFFHAENISFIPMTASLRGFAEANHLDLHYFDYRKGLGGHWNARTHVEAGHVIAKAMCPTLKPH
jgi:GDSL-like Lipase/Acylhydrolase